MQSGQVSGDQIEFLSVGTAYSSLAFRVADPLPSMPIMATTRLQLELLLNDSVIDLKGVTEVILADPGATLQILRSVGEEFPNEDDRPKRIEDCIVNLSLARCYQTICTSQSSHSGPYVAEWQHCRRLAECARELAKGLDGFSHEEAYLVGLLYRVGRFPLLLGWNEASFVSAECNAVGVMLATHWKLPKYLLLAIREQHELDSSAKWKEILTLAQQMAEQSEA